MIKDLAGLNNIHILFEMHPVIFYCLTIYKHCVISLVGGQNYTGSSLSNAQGI
jgi:hypothetical protein